MNSPLGYGEQIYGAASTGYNLGKVFNATTPMQLLGAGAVLPIGVDGLKINPEYTNSVTRPAPTPWAPADVGYYQRFDLRASYPLILVPRPGPDVSGDLRVGAGASGRRSGSTRISMTTSTTSRRLQLEDHLRLPYGVLAATVVFSQGLGGRGETQAAADGYSPLATGGEPDLQQAWPRRDLDPAPALRLSGRADRAGADQFGHPLFIAEQFSLDGSQGASAYPLGTFSVDEGATLRGEIQRPFAVGWTGAGDDRALHLRRRRAAAGSMSRLLCSRAGSAPQSFGIGVRLGARMPPPCRSARRSASNSRGGIPMCPARDRSIAATSPSP